MLAELTLIADDAMHVYIATAEEHFDVFISMHMLEDLRASTPARCGPATCTLIFSTLL